MSLTQQDLKSIQTLLNPIIEKLDRLESRIDQLDEDMNRKFQVATAEITNDLDAKFKKLEVRLNHHTIVLEHHHTDIEAIMQKIRLA